MEGGIEGYLSRKGAGGRIKREGRDVQERKRGNMLRSR